MSNVIDRLLSSPEPSIRYQIRVRVLGEPRDSAEILELRQEIKASGLVRGLLSARDRNGLVKPVQHTYKKWKGAHWVLAALADIGYPEADADLLPVMEQVMQVHFTDQEVTVKRRDLQGGYEYKDGVTIISGRPRCCASIPANVLLSAVRLGFADERCAQLAQKLIARQWADGGWNCDRKAEAKNSSFWETLIPLRALAAYAAHTGDRAAREAATRASEVFLKRKLFRRQSDGHIIDPDFVQLHYPCYWRYDILAGLKVMAEAGFIHDERCNGALDLLDSKRLPDGGWPAEARYYRVSGDYSSGTEWVSWGQVSSRQMNEWVTSDTLYVLKASGRL